MKTSDTIRYIIIAFFIITAMVIRFRNPDMTETRLLINFWWFWLIGIVACLTAFFTRTDS